MKSHNKASTIILFLLMSASIALAVQKGKAKGQQSNDRAAAVSIFMGGDRDVIRNFYSTNRGGLPPGLAKRGGDLPPGLAKQLQRNGHLPPGLEKRLSPFPVELERRLPPLRSGLMRGIIGGSAVIVNKKTSVILDLFTVF